MNVCVLLKLLRLNGRKICWIEKKDKKVFFFIKNSTLTIIYVFKVKHSFFMLNK